MTSNCLTCSVTPCKCCLDESKTPLLEIIDGRESREATTSVVKASTCNELSDNSVNDIPGFRRIAPKPSSDFPPSPPKRPVIPVIHEPGRLPPPKKKRKYTKRVREQPDKPANQPEVVIPPAGNILIDNIWSLEPQASTKQIKEFSESIETDRSKNVEKESYTEEPFLQAKEFTIEHELDKQNLPVVPLLTSAAATEVQCQHCHWQLKDVEVWRRHMLKHHGLSVLIQTMYACFCGFSTKSLAQMRVHARMYRTDQTCTMLQHTLTKAEVFECLLCPEKRFLSNKALASHLICRHFTIYSCVACDVISPELSFLQMHALTHQDVVIHSSRYCEYKFLTLEDMNKHLSQHVNKFFCHACKMFFPNFCLLWQHILSQHEDKPVARRGTYYQDHHTCPNCFTLFKSANELQMHQNVTAADEKRKKLRQLTVEKKNAAVAAVPKVECKKKATVTAMAPKPECKVQKTKAVPLVLTPLNGTPFDGVKFRDIDAPVEVPACWEIDLIPSFDFEIEGNFLRCSHCFVNVANEADARLHLLAHTTECCQECTFTNGVHQKCPRHTPYNGPSVKNAHYMILERRANSHIYTCLNCTLVTNKELYWDVVRMYQCCPDCRFSTRFPDILVLHSMHHQEPLPITFECRICNHIPMQSLAEFEEHAKLPHDLEPFKISLEPRQARSDVFRCPFCFFVGRAGIINHLRTHCEIRCTLCDTKVPLSRLAKHLGSHGHEWPSKRKCFRMQTLRKKGGIFLCRLCQVAFTTEASSDNHTLYEHTHLCSICQVPHENKRQLLEHVRTAHPKLPDEFICRQCHFVSFNPELMAKHRDVHSQPPPVWYTCDVCRTWRDSSQELQEHFKHAHNLGSGSLGCLHCGSLSFNSADDLRGHWSKFHPADQCVCTRCLEGSGDNGLPEHFWTCEFCGTIFPEEEMLEKHIGEQHKDSQYCILCDEVLKTRVSFQHHKKGAMHQKAVKKAAESKKKTVKSSADIVVELD